MRQLLQREEALFRERTPRSRALFERARGVLAGGVASSFQVLEPWPIYFERGEGCRLWDVDGNEYVDFHNGFSAMIQGHAHPAIVAAVERRVRDGTHFGAPSEDAVHVAEQLRRRFDLERWRFTSSGTEATMEALRIARAATGRNRVVVAAGVYHGHHDAVLPATPGVPQAVKDLTVAVPFNDVVELETAVRESAPAAVLLEPVRTNAGLVPPAPGYLERARELCTTTGTVLVFDEVKTGLTISPGGATERFGIRPDMVALAKALGAGLPSGAIGMTAELGDLVAAGRPEQLGTFNGNPLSMAAARASLEQVLTPQAYERLERLGERMRAGVEAATLGADAQGEPDDERMEAGTVGQPAPGERPAPLEGRVVAVGSKGCVQRGPADPVRSRLVWLWLANRGVLTTAHREQEWNLTVAHDEAAVGRYVEAFAELSRRWPDADHA